MGYAKDIILVDERKRDEIEIYEKSLAAQSLGNKIMENQRLVEMSDEVSISKTYLLYLTGETEIKHEVRRTITWRDKKVRDEYYIRQLHSKNRDIVLSSIYLMGILKDPLAIPPMNDILDLKDVELSRAIVSTLGKIRDPLSVTVLKNVMSTKNKELLLLALKTLAKRIDEVPWHFFRQFLLYGDSEIRMEAAFSIAIRRDPRSAQYLLHAIEREKDADARYELIRYTGMVPSGKILVPLLKMVVYDPDQKARLVASRTLDRLQGLIKTSELFNLRKFHDVKIRAEVIFRLGKFGAESERHMKFMRKTLEKSDNQLIIQACLQALGMIADHADTELLMAFIGRDPLSTYNALQALTHTWRTEDKDDVHSLLQDGLPTTYSATMALTKTWRIEDKDKILDTLHEGLSATQKQVILKYLIRRRGYSIVPEKLLGTTKHIIDKDDNINARYLSLLLLEHAPSIDTIEYLVDLYPKDEDHFEREAIEHVLTSLAIQHEDYVLAYVRECDKNSYGMIVHFIGKGASFEFYDELITILFERFGEDADLDKYGATCEDMCRIFISNPEITRAFMRGLPNLRWKNMFVKRLLVHAKPDVIESVQDDLVEMLKLKDEELKSSVMKLLIGLKNIKLVPHLIEVAEMGVDPTTSALAADIIKSYSEEGII
jgi:HEAT repeat protein